jgi:uncharacterized ferredoxin-like protein
MSITIELPQDAKASRGELTMSEPDARTVRARISSALRGTRSGGVAKLKCECGKCRTCYQREYRRRKRREEK